MSIWYPYYDKSVFGEPIQIERGEGVYLFDKNGKKYIDAISSWWTNIHGHAHPYIAEKVGEQLKKLEHVIFSGFTHEPAITLAGKLLKKLPSNQDKLFFSDNGSTAVEVALKMALQFHKNKGEERIKIIAFKNAYHGDTFGAMSVSGRSAFTNVFEKLLFDVIYIDVPTPGNEQKSINELKKSIANCQLPPATFIFEPLIQGTAGMVMYEPAVLDELISICKQNNIITIADEVMTGFGRTGKFFACDHLKQQPDIICMSKGLTGGTMAMGATSCTKEIYQSFSTTSSTFFHGHSYTGNPIACTAANASLDLFEKENTLKNVERIAAKHEQFVKQFNVKCPQHATRYKGTILAIEVSTTEQSSYFNAIRKKAYQFFLQKGIILRPLGNIIYVMPPYCISDSDLDYIYKNIQEFLATDYTD